MPQGRLLKQTLYAKGQLDGHEQNGFDYIKNLGWNRLRLHPSEMQSVLVDQEMWRLNLELLLPQPSRKSG